MESLYPLVSCLCVTYKRPTLLQRSIECFYGQTYPNKELIILCQDDDFDTLEFLKTIPNESITLIEVKSTHNLTLGAKRNLTIKNSKGEYFCNWDDDDWYHSNRIEAQMEGLRSNFKDASILSNIILYDSVESVSYLSFPWVWEGTILCKKRRGDEIKYLNINKGEDSYLLVNLVDDIFPILKPTLYIYTYNGTNTCDHEHFKSFFSKSQKLSPYFNLRIKEVLENKYEHPVASKLLLEEKILKELTYLGWAKPAMMKLTMRTV